MIVYFTFLVGNYVELYTGYSIIFQLTLNCLHYKFIHQKHYDEVFGVLGIVKIKFLDVKLQKS